MALCLIVVNSQLEQELEIRKLAKQGFVIHEGHGRADKDGLRIRVCKVQTIEEAYYHARHYYQWIIYAERADRFIELDARIYLNNRISGLPPQPPEKVK